MSLQHPDLTSLGQTPTGNGLAESRGCCAFNFLRNLCIVSHDSHANSHPPNPLTPYPQRMRGFPFLRILTNTLLLSVNGCSNGWEALAHCGFNVYSLPSSGVEPFFFPKCPLAICSHTFEKCLLRFSVYF